MGSVGIAPPILKINTRWKSVKALSLWKEAQLHTVYWAGWTPQPVSSLWRRKKVSSPCQDSNPNSSAFQPIDLSRKRPAWRVLCPWNDLKCAKYVYGLWLNFMPRNLKKLRQKWYYIASLTEEWLSKGEPNNFSWFWCYSLTTFKIPFGQKIQT
jgi:hypothetical protein